MTASLSTTTASRNTNNTAAKSSTTLLVALVDQTVTDAPTTNKYNAQNKEIYQNVRLPCPHNHQLQRDYLLLNKSHLMEIQSLDSDNPTAATQKQQQYQSWFVGNTVVSDGKLYVVSRVDPLFWILSLVKSARPCLLQGSTNKPQWQPLDQLLSDSHVPEEVLTVLDQNQIQHLAATYDMGDDEMFYKLTMPKCLQWLTRKQEAVERVLQSQLLVKLRQEEQEQAMEGNGEGAFTAGFSLTSSTSTSDNTVTPDSTTKKHPSTTLTPTLQQQAKYESIQIVCQYLTEEWQTTFLNHLDLTATKVLQDPQDERLVEQKRQRSTTSTPTASSKTSTSNNTTATAVTPVDPTPKAKPQPPKLSLAHKQLLKTNKKGMKSMTSFFAPKAKK